MTNKIGILAALIASISWGLLYNIDQKILVKTSPLTIFIVGGTMQLILLIPYIFTKDGHKDILLILSDNYQLKLLFVSEILCIIAGVAVLYAVKYLTAPIASAFEISYPFFVALFAYLMFNGSISMKLWIGLFLIFIGSLIIIK